MSVLSRANLVAQQRLDLQHLLSMDSFTAYDFRALIGFITGYDKAYIVRGFEVVGKSALSLTVSVADSMVLNPGDSSGSFYVGLPSDLDQIVELPAEQSNIFIEARFINETAAPVNTAFWNPLALSGDDVAGNEFGASTNSQNILKLQVTVNTVGFTPGYIKLYTAKTDSSSILEITDARELVYRLGTGGIAPDPSHKFPFSNGRMEPVVTGQGTGNAVTSSFRSRDASGIINDKGIRSQKEWMDAVMTRITEITGSTIWYANGLSQNYIKNLNTNTIFLDSEGGHSIQPAWTSSIAWSKASDNKLRSEGTEPVAWQLNYSGIKWKLGGSFTNNSPGGLRTYSDAKFESAVVPDGSNVYLLLERDVQKGSGNAVSWADNSVDMSNLLQTRAVSGVAGDFIGIAVGDYIRKFSEGYSRYYKVVKLSTGTSVITADASIADSSIVGLEVEADIASGVGQESLRFWRSNYSNADIIVDPVGLHPYQDIVYYWLGRRTADLFYLRNYGVLQAGEESRVGEDSFSSGTNNTLILEQAFGAVSTASGEYKLKDDATTTLITIRRRKRDNLTETPSAGDNSGASLTYTIDAPVTGFAADGYGLWVKLSDSTGGALTNGSVSENSPVDEENNESLNTNVWEVRSPADNPLRNFDNRDVYLVARRATIAGQVCLVFIDGTVLNEYGQTINNHLDVQGDATFAMDVFLETKSPLSVLFTDVGGRIDEDNANFFYDKMIPELGLINNRIGTNYWTLATPTDQDWLPNLGNNTLFIGSAQSTIRIRGNVQIDGDTLSVSTKTLQAEDPTITIGIGNLLNGGGGSGIEVADNTQSLAQYSAITSQIYIDLEYASTHGYSLGDEVGVRVSDDAGEITSGMISGNYKIVASGLVAGDAEIIDPNTLRIWTTETATSNETKVIGGTTYGSTWLSPSWIRMSDSSGDLSGMDSWAFRVKNVNQTVTLTPVAGYGIVATSNSVNMEATRIPFVNDDNAGPSGVDSTLDYSANLTWDNANTHLKVDGTEEVVVSITTPLLKGYLDQNLEIRAEGIGEINLTVDGDIVLTARDNRAVNLPSIAEPSSSIAGDLYFDNDSRRLKFHDGYDYRPTDNSDFTSEATGFPDLSLSTFSFNDGTRTFTLSPVGPHFDWLIAGVRYRSTSPLAAIIPNTTGTYFFYLDSSGALTYTNVFSPSILTQYAYVANVYWNAATSKAELLGEERHGVTMDANTHSYLHTTFGTRYVSGFAITPLAAMGGSGATDAEVQVDIGNGSIRDEDLLHTITNAAVPDDFFEQTLSPVAQVPVAYRVGSNGDWQKDLPVNAPAKLGASRLQYNTYLTSAGPIPWSSSNVDTRSAIVHGGIMYVGSQNTGGAAEVWALNGSSWINTNIPWSSSNNFATSMASFGGKLYVGSVNGSGGQVWSYDGVTWANANIPWSSGNQYTMSMAVFGGKLYVGSYNGSGGQVWSYDGVTWANTNASWSSSNLMSSCMASFGGKLYAATYNGSGSQVWSYDGVTWTNASVSWSAGNQQALSMEIYSAKLYISSYNGSGGQVWSYDGVTWANTSLPYIGTYAFSLASFGSNLYLGSGDSSGQVWSYNGSAWTNTSISWPVSNNSATKLVSYGGKLYACSHNNGGGKIWSSDGATWTDPSLPSSAWAAVDATADDKFVAYWIYATNDVRTPIVSIMGQGQYDSLTEAQGDALPESNQFGNFPYQEFKLLYRLIYKTNSAYANNFNAALHDITDYRRGVDTQLSSSYQPNDHGNLSGLSDDDHLQYLLLAGRTSGQTAYGAVNAGGTLTLKSTSNATKGQIILGSQVVVDESTDRLGLGVASPTNRLHLATGTTATDGILFGTGLSNLYRSASDTLKTDGSFIIGGTFSIGGALAVSVGSVKTANYAATVSDCVIPVNTTSSISDLTVTLPLISGANVGQMIIIKDVGGAANLLNKAIIIAPSGANTIDGSLTPIAMTISNFSLTFIASSSGWMII
jgi:hypothetical protein